MSSRPLGLPYPPYLLRVAARTFLMWLLMKCLFLALFGVVEGVSAFVFPSYGLPALLVWIDRRSAHEELLPANLGTVEAWLIMSPLLLCFVLDRVAVELLGMMMSR